MSDHDKKYGYIEVCCANSKCKKITKFRIDPERCNCSVCNTPLPLKRSPIKNFIKSSGIIGIAVVCGYSVANAPEIFQTKNEIIQIYEAMNACMAPYSIDRSKQRDLCACAFAETYENMKFWQDPKTLFEKNKSDCFKNNQS